jgi:hypothetical protein
MFSYGIYTFDYVGVDNFLNKLDQILYCLTLGKLALSDPIFKS